MVVGVVVVRGGLVGLVGGDGTSGTFSHVPCFNSSGNQTRGLIE